MGSKTPNKEAEGRLEIGVEEAAQTVGVVVTEVIDRLRFCGVKGSVVGKVCGDQIEPVKGVPEGIVSLNALYPGGRSQVVEVLLIGVGPVAVGISPLVAMDSSVVVGDKSSMSEEEVGTDTRGEV